MKLTLLLLCFFITFISADNNLKLAYHEHGFVKTGEISQFYLPTIPELSDKNKLVVVMFPLSGDGHLYVSSLTNATKEHSHWNSTHTGPNFIIVSKNDPNYKTGNYFISIFGVWDTNFKVLAYISDAEEIDLHDGEPQIAESKSGEFTKFKFNLKQNNTFSIGVTNILGWSTVFIDTEPNPSGPKHKWAAYNFGSNVYTIYNTDPNFKFGENVFYYLSVYGHTTKDSIFQVAATSSEATEVLNEGIPTATEVYADGYRYFEYQLSSINDLWIEVKPQHWGDEPYLCISNTVKKPRNVDDNCTWRQYGFDGRAHITIPKSEVKVGSFYIGVGGWPEDWESKKFTFVITAATRLLSRVLTDGQPITFQQKKGEMSWYRFYNGWSEESFIIQSVVHTGKLSMYASNDPTNMHPDKSQYDYKSVAVGNTESIRIGAYSDEGWYYIGCEALDTQVNFTITASSIHSINTLKMGNPYYYFGRLPENFYKIFVVELAHVNIEEDIEISTHFYSGSGNIFASNRADVSNERFIWASYWEHGLSITKKDLIDRKVQRLFIAVRSDSIQRSSFSIVVTFGSEAIQLAGGRNLKSVVTEGNYKNFLYPNGHGAKLRFVLTPITGNGDMYIGYSKYPTSIDYEFRSPVFGPKTLVIEPAYTNQDYYVSVKSRSGNFTFAIMVTQSYELLELGINPFPDDVAKDEMRVYRFLIPNYEDKVIISTTLIDGQTEMYLSRGSEAPNRTNYLIKSTDWPSNVISLIKNDTNYRPGFWTATIYGVENSDYFIGASTQFSNLEIGIPQSGITSLRTNIELHKNTYVSNIEPTENVFFNVKVYNELSCVRVYVSQDAEKLNPKEAKWQRRSVNGYLKNQVFIAIPSADLEQDKNWIYVAVEGCTDNDGKAHSYELLISQQSTPIYLTQEFTSIHANKQYSVERGSFYIVNSFKYSNGFNMYIESCTTQNIAGLIVGTTFENATWPIRRSQSQFVSTALNNYVQAVEITGDQFKNKKIAISLNRNLPGTPISDVYSVYSTLAGRDTRPMIRVIKSHFIKHLPGVNGKPHKDLVSVDISAIDSDSYPLEYQVYGLDVDSDQAKRANMETVCGIRNVMNLKALATLKVEKKQAVSIEIEIESNIAHKVNVIVKDFYGREGTSYTSVYFEKHVDLIEEFFNNLYLTLGTVVITLVSFGISFYLILGMIVKKLFFGSQGIEMIPNIGFWRDAPKLMKDGVVFLFTCGRRSSSGYDDLEDDSKIVSNTQSSSFESPSEQTKVAEVQGYGSI